MYCVNCGSRLEDETRTCPYCGSPTGAPSSRFADRSRLWAPIALIALLLLAFLLVFVVFRLLPGGSDGSSESDGQRDPAQVSTPTPSFVPVSTPVPTIAPTQVPTPSPVPLVPATEGTSTTGSYLYDIVYDSQGRLWLATEQANGSWYRWEYVYDQYGSFRYRARSIGAPATKWSGKYMPGTDITYCVLTEPVDNCIGMTIEYRVTKVTKGDGLGRRDLYIQTGATNWEKIGDFEYPSYSAVSATVLLDWPARLEAFATPRQNPDDSAFTVDQRLTEVWVADRNFVTLKEPLVPAW